MTMPFIVAFDGISFSGKETHSKRLVEKINEAGGQWSRRIEFPHYGTPHADIIEEFLAKKEVFHSDPVKAGLMFQTLQYASMQMEVHNQIRSIKGGILVIDRYSLTFEAYGHIQGVDSKTLGLMAASLPEPDVNIIMDIPAQESARRRASKEDVPDDFFEKDVEKLSKLRDTFLHFQATRSRSHPMSPNIRNYTGKTKYYVVDGNNHQDVVFAQLCSYLRLHNLGV